MDITLTVAGTLNAQGAGQPAGASKSWNRTFTLAPGGVTGDVVALLGSTNDGVSYQPLIDKVTKSAVVLTPAKPEAVIDDGSDHYALRRQGVGAVAVLTVTAEFEAAETPTPGDLDTLTLGDFPAGGVIGTAADTVDQFSAFIITQTTAGQALTIPPPTDPTPTRAPYYIQHKGTAGVDLTGLGLFVLPNSSVEIAWNGTSWRPISLGSSDGTAWFIGNNGGAQAVTIGAGSGDLVLNADNGGEIQAFTDTGAIRIDSQGGAILIGATSATAKAVTIGSVTGAASTTIRTGTGDLNLGIDATEHDTHVGSFTGGSAIAIFCGTGDCDVGSNATVHTTRLGSTTGASVTTVQSGTGALNIIRNGNTWVWPSAFGAAGSQLTDAAGNGVLSWA
jgi:hypothetical protein